MGSRNGVGRELDGVGKEVAGMGEVGRCSVGVDVVRKRGVGIVAGGIGG